MILDMGGSYRKLARIFKGSYLEIECSEEYAINLFPKKERFDSEFLAFLSTLLEKMVMEEKKLSQNDLRILERAVIKVYEPLSPDRSPLLQDVEKILKNYFLGDEEDRKRAYHFSKNLSIWTEGRFGEILNRPGKLSLDDRLIVFDLGKLTQHPELQSILFFVIRSSLSKKLHDTSLRKMIVIDEGWRFFNDEVGSRLIEELYRTARKSNGLVMSISQSPEDFLESEASTAILANSYVKYILKLQKGHELLSKLDLGENEIKAVRELEIRPGIFSEMFIKFLEHGVIAKLEPSGLDYWISTTDPEDFLEEEKLRRQFPGKEDLEILEALALRFPNGSGKTIKKDEKDRSGCIETQ
ncbi:MAG: ATP-binding protein [Candidatus Omnitrophica bacterium]|nr:ATP-binding protein [Candidatus Omnitrophota bacterium]